MRSLRPLLLSLLVTACAPSDPDGPAAGTFAGAGRDRLCIAGTAGALRGGMVTYAANARANCTVAGSLTMAGDRLTLKPQGEGACQIGFTIKGDRAATGAIPASCAYYCGPGATLAGKAFKRDPKSSLATDLAGDPLC